MGLVDKAVWYIESHSEGELTLEEIAVATCVSRFHLARAFSLGTGYSVMHYVRLRRMSEAARRLAKGQTSILDLAIRSGYGSHEAFSRAFRECFGVAPKDVRQRGKTDGLPLLEAFELNSSTGTSLPEPKIIEREAMLVAGLSGTYSNESNSEIASQWQRLGPHLGQVPDQVGPRAYGVICNGDDEGHYEYIAGIEVSNFSRLPDDFKGVRLSAQRYAVFSHDDHVSAIRSTCHAIFSDWLPSSSWDAVDAPFLEVYLENFDPAHGARRHRDLGSGGAGSVAAQQSGNAVVS